MAVMLLVALALGLNVAIGVVLVRKYLRTGKIGFIWLGVIVVFWPFVSSLLHWQFGQEPRGVAGQELAWLYPFNLMARARAMHGEFGEFADLLWETLRVGCALLLVVFLCRPRTDTLSESGGRAGKNKPGIPA
jgi:hypothetical protein